jgi:hypothetical protein
LGEVDGEAVDGRGHREDRVQGAGYSWGRST